MKILLLSAYTAASHQYWIDGLLKHFSTEEWTVLSLPPRFFNWRIRGNSLTWAFSERDTLSRHYDLILATSIVDLSALRGFVPSLATIKTLVYFHENQFVYPPSVQQTAVQPQTVEPQLVNLYTALCADTILFNSVYNQQTFLVGAEALLKKLPDGIPPDIVHTIKERSMVIPVPLIPPLDLTPVKDECMIHIVWNHRWEYDKGPDRLFYLLQQLDPHLPIVCHVVGQQFRQIPSVFNDIKQLLIKNNWLGVWGFLSERQDYLQLLANADVVLSTSLHDFQGLSILEAYQYHCIPIVPARLAYPEFIPQHYQYPSSVDNPQQEAQAAAAKLIEAITEIKSKSLRPAMPQSLDWNTLGKRYSELFGFN